MGYAGWMTKGFRFAAPAAVLLAIALLGVVPLGSAQATASSTFIASPPLAPGGHGAIDCPPSGPCVAVGPVRQSISGHGVSFATTDASGRWNSTDLPLPSDASNPIDAGLSSVSCPQAGNCVAVGTYETGTPNAVDANGLAEMEVNGVWSSSAVAFIGPSGFSFNSLSLNSIFCPSPGSCIAVGTFSYNQTNTSITTEGVVANLSGGRWSTTTLPGATALNGISCPAGGGCVAAGSSASGSAVFTQSGASWLATVLSIPPGPAPAIVNGISCPSPAMCVVVGINFVGQIGQEEGFVATGSGPSWQVSELPHPLNTVGAPANPYIDPSGVSCSSAQSCVAVGTYIDHRQMATEGDGPVGGIQAGAVWIDRGGSWKPMQVPPSQGQGSFFPGALLFGVTCTSQCLAVGVNANGPNDIVENLRPGGYWLVGSDGGLYAFSDAPFKGSVPGVGVHVNNVVAMAGTVDGNGYWLVGSDGGLYAFGDAPFKGSVPGVGVHVNNVVAMAPTPDGGGYWLVGADGGLYAFGDAPFFGSVPGVGVRVNNIIGIAPTPDGFGYWLIGADGGVYAFGDAPFEGSVPGAGIHVNNVTSISATPFGGGYWVAGTDGGVYAFGDAPFEGSVPGAGVHVNNVTSISATADGGGYLMAGTDGGVYAFGDSRFEGSVPGAGVHINNIVFMAGR